MLLVGHLWFASVRFYATTSQIFRRLVFRWLLICLSPLKCHSLKGDCFPALNKNPLGCTIAGFETTRGAWGPSLCRAILSDVRESSSSLPTTETDAPLYALSGVKCCEHHTWTPTPPEKTPKTIKLGVVWMVDFIWKPSGVDDVQLLWVTLS